MLYQLCFDRFAVTGDDAIRLCTGNGADGVVEQGHEGGELVTVGSGDAQQHINPWPPKFGFGQQLDTARTTAVIPLRTHAKGHHRLRFHDALMAQGFTRPQR
ncbi:hypothetical protein SDC9_196315 [bioreactor metagenome]|uniref:Uncharacterized protein n=1 Tax=bioreactor metagenome TaxID=1076179 RepID=A0A645IN88_9ZZZZ